MTYTSLDGPNAVDSMSPGRSTGGWQVKNHRGLSADEIAALCARVNLGLDIGRQLSRFPSAAEIAKLPRRLVYAPVGPGFAWWHTSPAGSDSSGRPGNVFVHILLRRSDPAGGASLRPIDLWRSPDWLTPFGVDAVRSADLPRTDPVRPGPMSVQGVASFLLDFAHVRLPTFGALIDAVAGAISGGRRVVLAADADEAALWISSVSAFMTRRSCQGFYFSTLERGGQLEAAFSQGVHLVVIPTEDADLVRRGDDLVLIQAEEPIEIGTAGGAPHRTSRGWTVDATLFSAMVRAMVFDEPTTSQVLETLDELTSGLTEDGTEPGWGLAMVIATERERFADAEFEAAQVIMRSSPARLPSALHEVTTGIIQSQLGADTGDAWSVLSRLDPGSGGRSDLFASVTAVYLQRAVTDRGWLSRPAGVPLTEPVSPRWQEVTSPDGLSQSIQRQLDGIGSEPGSLDFDPALLVARLTDLGVRLGLAPVGSMLAEQLGDAVDRDLGHRLTGPGGAELIDRIGPLTEATLARLIRPVIERSQELNAPLSGAHLHPELVRWLYPDATPADGRHVMHASSAPATPLLRGELAFYRLENPHLDDDDRARERVVLAESLLVRSSDDPATGILDQLLAEPVRAEDLFRLASRAPGMIPGGCFVSTLAAVPADASLLQLCQLLVIRLPLVRPGRDDEIGRLLAEVRLEAGVWWQKTTAAAMLRALGGLITLAARVGHWPEALCDDFRGQLRAATIVAGIVPVSVAEQRDLRQGLQFGTAPLSADELEVIERAAEKINAGRLLLQAVLCSAKSPAPKLAGPNLKWAGAHRLAGTEELTIVDHLVHQLIARNATDEDILRAMLLESLVAKFAAHPAELSLQRPMERFATTWFKARLRCLPSDRGLGWVRGGTA